MGYFGDNGNPVIPFDGLFVPVLADMGTFYPLVLYQTPPLFPTDERDKCFDQESYDKRYALERNNAWMGSHRSLLNRFDTTTGNRKGVNYLSFIVLLLEKPNSKSLNDFIV